MKVVKALLIVAVLLIATPQPAKAGFISDMIGGFFGDIVGKASEDIFKQGGELIEKAKRAFLDSMDVLFDEKIKPMIYQIQSMVDRAMGQMDDLIQKTIQTTKDAINDVVNNAAKKAMEFVDFTVDQIKTKIIDNAFDQLRNFENKLMGDIMIILNKVDEIILKISCSIQAVEVRVREFLYKNLPSIPNPFDSCRIKVDAQFPGHSIRWKLLSSFESNELYELKKCYIVNPLTETTPVQSILMAYRDVEFLAAGMRCYSISVGSLENQKYYIREMAKCSQIIDTYEGFVSDASPLSAVMRNLK